MALENSELSAEDLYRQRTQTSEALSRRAREVFPSGITHDSRFMQPHPISIDRADRSRKWDVDGNEYVDLVGGLLPIILGYCDHDVDFAIGICSHDTTMFIIPVELFSILGNTIKVDYADIFREKTKIFLGLTNIFDSFEIRNGFTECSEIELKDLCTSKNIKIEENESNLKIINF